MSTTKIATRWGQRKLISRFSRVLPWIGTALAIAAVASAVRRKGVVGGTVDTALNAIPVVGAVKSVAEIVRGRDFIRDRA